MKRKRHTGKILTVVVVLELLALLAIFTMASHKRADAQMIPTLCAPHDPFVASLNTKFGETLRGRAIGGRGTLLLELFRSEKGSFTLTVTTPDGKTCLLAGGHDWEDIAARPAGSDS